MKITRHTYVTAKVQSYNMPLQGLSLWRVSHNDCVSGKVAWVESVVPWSFFYVPSYDLPLIGAVMVGVSRCCLCLSGIFVRVVVLGCIIFWWVEAATCRVDSCCPGNG